MVWEEARKIPVAQNLFRTSNLIGSCWPEALLFQSWGSLLVLFGLGLSIVFYTNPVSRSYSFRPTRKFSTSIFLPRPHPQSYNPRRPPPRYIWKWRWPQLTLRHAVSRRSHEKNGGLWTAYKIYGLFRNASNRTHPLLMAWRFIGYCFSKPLTVGPYCMIDDFANSEVMATNCIKVSSRVY